MNPLLQCKPTILPLFIAGVLAFGLLPKALAVVPPPDGGYPGFNTAEGTNALQNLTTGVGNTAAGWHSLFANSAGNLNTAIGAGALLFNTGGNNTATGALALLSNTTGLQNTANGAFALLTNTDGRWNTAIGDSALSQNTIGDRNTTVGYAALSNNTTGGGNVALGANAGANVTTAANVICIGNNVGGTNTDSSCYIGSIAGQTVGAGGTTCYVDNDGKLGVFLSAHRFKTDIADMGNASEALLALRPVTFHYNPELDKTCIPQFGLIAEEVAKVNPDLVTHDAKGELYTVRYEAINVMLLNEFLKEHRKNSELQATITQLKFTVQKQETANAQQQKQIEALTAGLQKVSAQLELSKAVPQTVLNNQ
jgi:trimeric autotransporter adhesin